jgi:hypothetical protein
MKIAVFMTATINYFNSVLIRFIASKRKFIIVTEPHLRE